MPKAKTKREQHLCFYCDEVFTSKEDAESCEKNHALNTAEISLVEESDVVKTHDMMKNNDDNMSSECGDEESQLQSKQKRNDDDLNLAIIKYMKKHIADFDCEKAKSMEMFEKAALEMRQNNLPITAMEISERWSQLTRNYIETYLANQNRTGKDKIEIPKFFEEFSFLLEWPPYNKIHNMKTHHPSNQPHILEQQVDHSVKPAPRKKRQRCKPSSYKQLIQEIRLMRKETTSIIPIFQEECRASREIMEQIFLSVERIRSNMENIYEVTNIVKNTICSQDELRKLQLKLLRECNS